ncbi:MAG: oligoendopeptidase F [Clostridiales bacterium]|jgi:oligoendopeptidase F|nr:oligoendopeptidase F [Clostridiales bacterium]
MEIKQRSEIQRQYKWRIEDLYALEEGWQFDYDVLSARENELDKYRGRLGDASVLLECLRVKDELEEAMERLFVYANMRLHEDSRVSEYQGMADKAGNLLSKLSASAAFIEPEILALPDSRIKNMAKPGLEVYRHYLDNLARLKAHVLSPEMEELLARSYEIAEAPQNAYSMLNNADMKFAVIKDEYGKEVQITHGRYISLMESANRDVRRETFNAFYAEYIKMKNTIAALYNASVKKDIFFAKAHKFSSSIEASLAENNIPVQVYTNLIKVTEEFLPDMHRYVRLRKKILNLPELHMYDLYTPLVPEADTKVTYEDAKATVLQALTPMGAEYTRVVKSGFNSGWIDVYENEGKRSGAYSWGAYGRHPYVLMNFDNKLNDMFTIAHEMGHAMHSYYSWDAQPYVYSGHTIFTAEVASTVNEALLTEHLLKVTADDIQRRYIINHFIEQFRSTVFRQTMFAEFEMLAHQMAEQGEPLTVSSLCELYRGLNEKYYGGGIILDSQIDFEWARIPHFYNAFYVYQYATGFSAAVALSRRILREGAAAVDDYVNFLRCGSSEYSIDQLKKAGVDMSASTTVRQALSVFRGLIDKLEAAG